MSTIYYYIKALIIIIVILKNITAEWQETRIQNLTME